MLAESASAKYGTANADMVKLDEGEGAIREVITYSLSR